MSNMTKTRRFVKNGVEYKRVAVFRGHGAEQKADSFVKRLESESPSRRFIPIIEKVHWVMSANSKLLGRLGFTSYRVYVPIRR